MKTSLSLGLMLTTLCALPACSSDEGTETRGNAGSTAVAGSGGAPTAGGGTGGAPAAGGGGAGGTGGAPAASAYTAGPALVITPTAAGANVVDEDGDSGITGGVILAQSPTLDVTATVAHQDGKLCMSGTTATVLAMDYDTYWGAEMALDLRLVPDPAAPAPAADAGADAGAGAPLVRQPWPIGDVKGFSFVVTGNGPNGEGVPPGLEDFRFKALPQGSDPALDTFCSQPQPTSGETVEVPLTEVTWQCWAAGNPSVVEPQLNVIPTAGGTLTTRTNPNALLSISWQVAANVTAPTPFDFCVSDIKPLYAAAP
jgi:hypothetical protein